MIAVVTPLAYKVIGPFRNYWFLLTAKNKTYYFTFLIEVQKSRSPGRSGKIPGRETGRDLVTAGPIFILFHPVSPTSETSNLVHVFTGSRKPGNGKLQMTFSSQMV